MFYSRIFEKLVPASDVMAAMAAMAAMAWWLPKHLTASCVAFLRRSKVGKQKGVELALFSPVDFDERLQGSWCPWVHDGPWVLDGFGTCHKSHNYDICDVAILFDTRSCVSRVA